MTVKKRSMISGEMNASRSPFFFSKSSPAIFTILSQIFERKSAKTSILVSSFFYHAQNMIINKITIKLISFITKYRYKVWKFGKTLCMSVCSLGMKQTQFSRILIIDF